MKTQGEQETNNLFIDTYARHVGTHAISIYFLLCRHSNQTDSVSIMIKTISKKLNFSKPTIIKAIKILESLNIIKKRYNGKAFMNTYTLIDEEQWKETNKIQEVNKKKGYIYLIKSKNLYKIGKSLEIKNRMNTYKTENPFGIKIIFQVFVEDYVIVENELLNKFQNKKIKNTNEWFSLNEEDVKEIKNYLYT